MKSSRKYLLLGFAAVAAHAELSSWVRFAESGSALEQAFFRLMPLPGGQVLHRRPPSESQVELTKLITASPSQADLYALRGLENERLLDFAAAEADWKKQVELAADKRAANLALADYYHRRLQVNEEMAALSAAANDKAAFDRMLALAQAQLLPPDRVEAVYRLWRERLPKEAEPYQRGIAFFTSTKQFDKAAAWIADYAKQAPGDAAYPLAARAEIEKAKGNSRGAIEIYDRSFDPLWPAPLMQAYFTVLRDTRSTRQFLTNARNAAQANPQDLGPATRIYHYYTQEGNPGAGMRALIEFQRRKPNLSAAELGTLAQLWRSAGNPNEAARAWYALYSMNGDEAALAGLIDLLMSGPHYLALGSGDLTFYKDIASADSGPGFLNGILSLLLNSSEPASRFDGLQRTAVAYFERSRAAELLALFDQRFPNSQRREGLREQLIRAYAAHGETEAVIRTARAFLTGFANSPLRTQVTLLMTDALAARGQTREELAAYDKLLGETKSPDYERVLDRYIARLVALKRPKDGLVLLRREIDRKPSDAKLYEKLAAYVDQNKMATEIEQVYKRAMAQFPDGSWHQKLARYYLRTKQTAQFQQLTGDVSRTFAGSDLEKYFADVVANANLDAVLYRQVNLYANQRFPNNLTFVRNLLSAYERRGTVDPVAYENLLRRHWFYADDLRARFFEHLSRTGKLATELAALNRETNPASTRMLAEAEIWRSHFETAAAPLGRVYGDAPGDWGTGERAVSLHRSLELPTAAVFAKRQTTSRPRDWQAHTEVGEIDDHAAFRRIAAIEPGNAAGYLESATLFWDYFEYDNALGMIEQGRKTLGNGALHAYEAGAIYENKRDYARAIAEYRKGANADPGGSAQQRLIALSRRPAFRQTIDAATASDPMPLRMALLEEQQRKADLEGLLDNAARSASTFEQLAKVEEESRRLGFPAVEERALRREIELTTDPVDKLRARLNLARVFENRKDLTRAAETMESLYRDNPKVIGIVRAAVDYYWRNGNSGRALDILNRAAADAHASRKDAYAFEYAGKATEAGRYANARRALEPLMASQPQNTTYIAAMADTYAREGNTAALKTFYEEKIRTAPAGDRDWVAQMRRALAGVLARNKDYAGALDQYIEVINRFPEDAALVDEVANFARTNKLEARLVSYYQKTTADSPKDYRYHLVLARVQSALEDYPAAVAAYAKASEVRPDRADLLEARAGLEERLLRFDEAAASYAKLYELTYRNSAWMTRVAEVRARQRRTDDVIAALKLAYPDTAEGAFASARLLAEWDMLPQARTFAERGLALAGAKLMEDYRTDAEAYARVLARLREYRQVKQDELLPAVADVARAEYSLEEKRALGTFLEERKAGPELGRRAGMADWEARKLVQLMMAKPGADSQPHMQRLIELQRSRLAFRELGQQLEAYYKVYPAGDDKEAIRDQAAAAYAAIGDDFGEIRVARGRRAYDLMAQRNPKALIAAGNDDAINAAIEAGKADTALAAVAARTGRPPVWTQVYTALLGVYFNLHTPGTENAFTTALGPMRIGDQRTKDLVGSNWYYLAARYGEYANSDDFLPAEIEESPGDADLYYRLAEHYREAKRPAKAMADYEHALQLEARHIGAMNRVAQLLMADGKRELAVARWRMALDAVVAEAEVRRPRYSLATDLDEILQSAVDVRAESERAVVALLRRGLPGEPYVKTYAQKAESPAGAILVLASQVREPAAFLGEAAHYDWLDAAQRDQVYQRLIELTRAQMMSAVGEAQQNAANEYYSRLQQWLDSLLGSGQAARVRTVIASFTQADRDRLSYWLPKAQILMGRLDFPVEDREAAMEAAAELRKQGKAAEARRILHIVYERDLAGGNKDVSTFVGYAEVLVQEGDVAGAVRVLRRMTLVTDPPFANHVAAANLLAKYGKTAEAAAFRDEALKATPWNREARARAERTPPATLQAAETAVRNDPSDPALKLDVFRLARAAGRHALAVSAITHPTVPQDHGLDRELADSYAKTGRLDQAIATVADRPAMKAQADRWRAEIKARQTNLERMPVVTQNLKQDRVVRPMVVQGGAR